MMDLPTIKAFIQARMSSQRFPGKVLALFQDRPVIEHVIDAVRSTSSVDSIVILTSVDPTDDSLAKYLSDSGHKVFRGPLHDVFERFKQGIRAHPCSWVLRVCADSPLLSPNVIESVSSHIGNEVDVVTTRFSPPFPKGQNLDLIRSTLFRDINSRDLTSHDREHVTPWFYRNRAKYRIKDATPVTLEWDGTDFTVDTPEDLRRLEGIVSQSPKWVRERHV